MDKEKGAPKKIKFIPFKYPFSIFKSAEGFFASSNLLLYNARKFMHNDSSCYMNAYGSNLFEAAYANLSFSLELYFKCMICLEENNLYYDHNLYLLFTRISKANQIRITNYYESRPYLNTEKPPLVEVLIDMADSFERLRYSFQGYNYQYNDILHIVIDTKKVIQELHPKWEPLVANPHP
jgi:hypothetical protein